jgi:hypothetical protein
MKEQPVISSGIWAGLRSEARSALPEAPVLAEAPSRLPRSRSALAVALRAAADRVAPQYPAPNT